MCGKCPGVRQVSWAPCGLANLNNFKGSGDTWVLPSHQVSGPGAVRASVQWSGVWASSAQEGKWIYHQPGPQNWVKNTTGKTKHNT